MHKRKPFHAVSKELEKNVAYLKKELGVEENFDVIYRPLQFGNREMALFFIDGFAKDEAITQIQRQLFFVKEEDLKENAIEKLVKTYIPYVEIDTTDDLDEVVNQVLAGPIALVIDGEKEIIIIDTRTYEVRGPEEPDTEQLIRGSKDGFVETIVTNVALIRRRVRDRSLCVHYMSIGRRSRTDISVCYLKDIADEQIVNEIIDSLEAIDTDGLPMGDKTLEEFLFGHHWNPYPLVRYTERPDVASTHLFEGHVIIIVDGSPSVMICPTTFWHHLQHAEEYRQKPIIGACLRFVRFIAVWASIFLIPLWYLIATNDSLRPEELHYIGLAKEEGHIPLIAQFIIAEIGIETLRMAAIHTPNALVTALGLVAAILIGEVAVEVGLFSHEVVLYLAVAAIGTFATPSYELSLANRIIRVVLLLVTAIFSVPGFVIGFLLWIFMLARMNSLKTPYLWPFIPFDFQAMRDVFLRTPIPLKHRRPPSLRPLDPDR